MLGVASLFWALPWPWLGSALGLSAVVCGALARPGEAAADRRRATAGLVTGALGAALAGILAVELASASARPGGAKADLDACPGGATTAEAAVRCHARRLDGLRS